MLTTNKFSPSINILRDESNFDIEYIPTPNTSLIFKQIIDGYQAGNKRSFSIVGSYGTGKSAFLWALRQTLANKKTVFPSTHSKKQNFPAFEFLSLVGTYDSFIGAVGDSLGEQDSNPQKLLKKLELFYQNLETEQKGLVILVDEFGKFLEYAAKNNPEKELYFVQQLAELANDSDKNILFVITLHQGFEAYSLGLDKHQRQEWDKVRGRLKELAFNEPVEQLLLLAAQRINAQKTPDKKNTQLFKAIETAKIFPLRDYFSEDVANKLYPFDILSAAILALALQRYGQNERSLFSFIDGDDYLGFSVLEKNADPFYHVVMVYEYLNYNYYNFINSKYNPDFAQWASIKIALERVEAIADLPLLELSVAKKMVILIGVLGMFSPNSAHLDKIFLLKYSQYALGISKNIAESVLERLETIDKIVFYQKYRHRFILTEGTDLDIQAAIEAAQSLIEPNLNIVHTLKDVFSFPYILAKENYYKFGTPRFFGFRLADSPIHEVPQGEIDGFVNLIFSETLTEEALQLASVGNEEAILYGWYQNTSSIKSDLIEIEKIKKVIELNLEDKVATRELNSILLHYQKRINDNVLGNLYAEGSSIIWYFRGERINFSNRTQFQRYLSIICDTIYPQTPRLMFEMINKTKLSGAMATARKKLLEALVENHESKYLGFDEDKFPPEKSIYLALLGRTGIHQNLADKAFLQDPTAQDVAALWHTCEAFVESSKQSKRSIAELVAQLRCRPIKLKDGLLDFWIPIFLFVKRDDFALFEEDKQGQRYVPSFSKEILELISVNPHHYYIKAFNIDGVRLNLFNSYRVMLEQSQELMFSNKIFIETIRPFLKFYRDLPLYSKNTKRLSADAIALRDAIAQAKDPEKSFFEDFPTALGYTTLNLQTNANSLGEYVGKLQQTIREIRTSFDELINRFELYLLERLGLQNMNFETYKTQIQARFKKLQSHLLLPTQKPFYQRIQSGLNDRRAWLLSIAQACLGKQIESITDAEELTLFNKLKLMIHELDNITEISAKDIDESNEVFYQLNVSSLNGGLKNSTDSVRLPKSKIKAMEAIATNIKKSLSDDHELNIAILTQLLQEQINHGKKS